MQPDPASESLPFGALTIDEVFFDYDFPRLFSSSSHCARLIATCILEDEEAATAEFLYLQIEQADYDAFRCGEVALRDWIDAKNPPAWILTWEFTQDGIIATAKRCNLESLDDSLLPAPGVKLSKLSKTAESAENLRKLGHELSPNVGKYLRVRNVTTATRKSPERLARDFLRFHGHSTVEQYQAAASAMRQSDFALAARKENEKSTLDQHAVNTWLRMGEKTGTFRDAANLEYREEALRGILPELRRRCAAPDTELLDDIRNMLGDVGVAFILLAPPEGVSLHGMTRWINKRVPVIQQTGRRLTDGFIIVTLFHEIGHILGDPRGETHLEFTSQKGRDSHSEKAARKFAHQTLFGPGGANEFRGLKWDAEIAEKARQVGVSPGVAVWEMHRRRWLPHSHGNGLFFKFDEHIE